MKINKMMMIGAFAASNLIALHAHATGDRVGNGADAVFCEGAAPEILDSYEARAVFKKELNLPSDQSYAISVDQVISKITEKDLYRGSLLKIFWNELKPQMKNAEAGIQNPVVELTEEKLQEVQDEMIISLPGKCRIQQLVLQVDPDQISNDAWKKPVPRYTIQKQIWSVLSENQRAATLLHEMWYRYYLSRNAHSSRNARALNATFLTTRSQELGFYEYVSLLRDTEAAEIGKASDPEIIRVEMRFNTPFKKSVPLKAEFHSRTPQVEFVSLFDQEFQYEGHSFSLKQMGFDSVSGSTNWYEIGVGAWEGGWRFFHDGDQRFHLGKIFVRTTSHAESIQVDFYPSGKIKTIFKKNIEKISMPGLTLKYPDHDLQFDEQGNLIP